MFKRFKFSDININEIKQCVELIEDAPVYNWDDTAAIILNEREIWLIKEIVDRIYDLPIHLLNEATIWARAIYPLLLLSETKTIRIWSELLLSCQYQNFSLEGIVDGVLGKTYSGRMDEPYLVVIEAKRGIEANNPVAQSYAQLLTAARLNWEQDQKYLQVIFGCYTIADSWTFIRAEIEKIETNKPVMRVTTSREYVEKLEAEQIARILKHIVQLKIQSIS